MVEQVNDRIDEFEAMVADCNYPLVDCPVKHTFTDGMYIREIFMPKDTYVTSLCHNTKHPYFVMVGKCKVVSKNFGGELIEAPYFGVTVPNTRRLLYILEPTVWITCHVTDIKPENDSEAAVQAAVDKIGDKILKPYENKLLNGYFKNNVFIPKQIENA